MPFRRRRWKEKKQQLRVFPQRTYIHCVVPNLSSYGRYMQQKKNEKSFLGPTRRAATEWEEEEEEGERSLCSYNYAIVKAAAGATAVVAGIGTHNDGLDGPTIKTAFNFSPSKRRSS